MTASHPPRCVDAHPGSRRKHSPPAGETQRCRVCRRWLIAEPSAGEILSIHLQHSPECRDGYADRNDLMHVGNGALLIASTLHVRRKRSNRWCLLGVAPNGEMRIVEHCRSRRAAEKLWGTLRGMRGKE